MNISVLSTFIILLALGTWQMDRKAQKADLLEKLQRVNEEIVNYEEIKIDKTYLDDWVYRKLRIGGTFMNTENINAKSVYVFTHLSEPRGEFGGAGYWVLNPFLTTKGKVLIINRGFVPQHMFTEYLSWFDNLDYDDSINKMYEEVLNDYVSEFDLTGYVRKFEKKTIFTPETNYEEKILYSFEKSDIIRILNLEEIEPYFIDQIDDITFLPAENETLLKFPNNHLSYAITWYGLATGLLFIYFYSRIRIYK